MLPVCDLTSSEPFVTSEFENKMQSLEDSVTACLDDALHLSFQYSISIRFSPTFILIRRFLKICHLWLQMLTQCLVSIDTQCHCHCNCYIKCV